MALYRLRILIVLLSLLGGGSSTDALRLGSLGGTTAFLAVDTDAVCISDSALISQEVRERYDTDTKDVTVDFGTLSTDPPLVKKFGMFQSGLVDMARTDRDFYKIDALKPESLRLLLGFGKPNCIFHDVITGTADTMQYNWTDFDHYGDLLTSYDVLPYWAYTYCPYPLQVDGDWKSQPGDLTQWQGALRTIAAHFRNNNVRIGYHEVWNEPDLSIFYTGTWSDYLELYRYGATGIQQGDPDAVIGGPSTAWVADPGTRYKEFLEYVYANDLPLDYFSMHSYGLDYLERIARVRSGLENIAPRFMTTSIHVNEINTDRPPWPIGGELDRFPLAVDIFRAIGDLVAQNDVEVVSWAQFMESGVDGLGVVDVDGHVKASYNAFEIWARMPVDRYEFISSGLSGMASSDGHRASVLLWNDTVENQSQHIAIDNLPFNAGIVDIYRIDGTHSSYYDGAGEGLVPVESMNLDAHSLALHRDVPAAGVLYIEINDGSGISELEPSKPGNSQVIRQHHYYPTRGLPNYAYFDEKTWIARLGIGTVRGGSFLTDSIVAVAAEDLPATLDVSFATSGKLEQTDDNSLLGLRLDYEAGTSYTKSVLFHGGLYSANRNSVPQWGTKALPDEVYQVDLASFQIKPSRYAPADWSGRVIITYEMQNSGPNSSAKVVVR